MAENKILLNEKCENILSQDQIGLPKPHVFSKKCENHTRNGLKRHKKKCEKIYNFKVNPAHFRNQNTLLSIFNSQVTVFFNNYQMYP